MRPKFSAVEGSPVTGEVDDDVDVWVTIGVSVNRESPEKPTIDRFPEHGNPPLVDDMNGPEMQPFVGLVVSVLEHVDNGVIHIDVVENDPLPKIRGERAIVGLGHGVGERSAEPVVKRWGAGSRDARALDVLEQNEEAGEVRVRCAGTLRPRVELHALLRTHGTRYFGVVGKKNRFGGVVETRLAEPAWCRRMWSEDISFRRRGVDGEIIVSDCTPVVVAPIALITR